MARRQIDRAIPFPYEGIRELTPLEDQQQNSTAKAQNVRPFNWLGSDADRGRMGGGQRPGVKNFHGNANQLRSSTAGFTHGNSIQSLSHISTSNVEEMAGEDRLSVRSDNAAQAVGVSVAIGDIEDSDNELGGSLGSGEIHGSVFDLDDNLYVIRSTTSATEALTVEKWVLSDADEDGINETWSQTGGWTSTSVTTGFADDWWLQGACLYGDYLYLWVLRTESASAYAAATTTAKTEQILRLDITSSDETPTLSEWIDNSTDSVTTSITVGKRGWRTGGSKSSGNCLVASRGRLSMLMDHSTEGFKVVQRVITTGEVILVTDSGLGGEAWGVPRELASDSSGNLWCIGDEANTYQSLFVVDRGGVVTELEKVTRTSSSEDDGAPRSITYDAVNDRMYVVGRRSLSGDWGLFTSGAGDFLRSSFRAYHASESKIDFVQQNVSPSSSDDYGADRLGGFAAEVFPFSLNDKVQVTTTGTLPVPLAVSTDYYIVGLTLSSLTNTYNFQLSATKGGSAVDITDSGSSDGKHTLTRPLGEICRIKDGEASSGTAGTVTEVVVINGGSGYTGTPTAVFSSDAGGSGEGSVTVTTAFGVITAIASSGGTGYTDEPTVTISGGSGSGAKAIAIVRRGEGDPITFTPRGMHRIDYVRAKTNGSVFISHSESVTSPERTVNLCTVRVDNIDQAQASSASGVATIATADTNSRLCDKMGISSTFALDQGETNSTRQTVTLAVAGGTVRRVGPVGFPKVENGDHALATDVPVIHSVSFGQRIFFADGISEKYYDHPVSLGGIRGEVKSWGSGIQTYSASEIGDDGLKNVREGKSKGVFPKDTSGGSPRLIEVWNGRIVLAGIAGLPAEWYMSRQNNPFDFDYSVEPSDSQQASSSPVSGPGGATDKINAMIPFGNDVLLFGCDHSILQMSGDPMLGARWDYLSTTIGMAWGRPWCKAPGGAAYFFGSKGGVYIVTPNRPPTDITNFAIRERTSKISMSDHIIRLAWNEREQGVHVFVSPIRATSATEHYYYDVRTSSWWIDKFEARWGGSGLEQDIYPHNAVSVHEFDGDAEGDRVLLLGGRDGRLYKWDVTAQSDYLGKTQTPISSNVYYGPFNLQNSQKVTLSGINCILSEGSSDVDYDVLIGKTAEEIVNSTDESKLTRFSGTWTSGRNNVDRGRAVAHDIMLKVKSDSVSTAIDFGDGYVVGVTSIVVDSTSGFAANDKIAITDSVNATVREAVTISSVTNSTTLSVSATTKAFANNSTVDLVDKDWSVERIVLTLGDTGRRSSRAHSVGKKS